MAYREMVLRRRGDLQTTSLGHFVTYLLTIGQNFYSASIHAAFGRSPYSAFAELSIGTSASYGSEPLG